MKTIKTIVGISLICCILFGLVLISLNMTEIRPTATNLAPQQTVRGLHVPGLHAAITINGNTAFATQASSQGWPGDGSAGTPYVISDYVIIALTNPGVYILNTNKYFIIENVTVRDALPHEGFVLNNVTHGELRNNIAINISAGFTLMNSPNNILSGNTAITNSQAGFGLYSSDNNDLMNNTAKNTYSTDGTGFYLSDSQNNNLTGNTARDSDLNGFALWDSQDNTLINNTALFNKQGFYISGSDNKLTGNTATVNTQSGFNLHSCSLNTLLYNTATSNGDSGFLLDNTSQNILLYNTATDNGANGFTLSSTLQSILVYNTATDNDANGLRLVYTNYSTFGANTLSPNGDDCISEFGCVGNTFTGNICEEDSGIPGFNLAILIGMLAVISIVFFLRKYQYGRLNLY